MRKKKPPPSPEFAEALSAIRKPEREGPKLSERLDTGDLDPALRATLDRLAELFAEDSKRSRAELRAAAIKTADSVEDRKFAAEWLGDFLYCYDRLPPPAPNSEEWLVAFGAIDALMRLHSQLRWEFSSKGGKAKAKWQTDPIVLAIEQENRDQSAAETARRIRKKGIKGLPATCRTVEDWVHVQPVRRTFNRLGADV